MNANGGPKSRKAVKPYWEMTTDELRAATADLNREMLFEETRPLSRQEQARWSKAKKRGRPRVGKGARAVLISVERGLLSRADKFAKAHGTNRSRLIAIGLETVLSAPKRQEPRAAGVKRTVRSKARQ